jgi:hypothetical protein
MPSSQPSPHLSCSGTRVEGQNRKVAHAHEKLQVLSEKVVQSIDRAMRGADGWLPGREASQFEFADRNNNFRIIYHREGASLQELRHSIKELNPRSADVWRVVSARLLEAWTSDLQAPPPVWLDVDEIVKARGYRKATGGGYRPAQREEAARILRSLEALHVEVPLGEGVYSVMKGSKARKWMRLKASRSYRAIVVKGQEQIRTFGGESLALRLLVELGQWTLDYPRQFTEVPESLIHLSGRSTRDQWAKALGMELAYQFRQDQKRDPRKTMRVATLLRRANVLSRAVDMRNKIRVRDYFEKALDTLQEHGSIVQWVYHSQDADQLDVDRDLNAPWFDIWLEARVRIDGPAEFVASLPKNQRRKKAGKLLAPQNTTRPTASCDAPYPQL